MSASSAATPSGSWYHGPISRIDCERLLSLNGLDGCYLVRSSETVKGAYVLSVMQQNRIVHYRIVPDDSGQLVLQTNRQGSTRGFTDLNELILYYQAAKHGLCSQLLHSIEPAKEEVENDEETDGEDDDVGEPIGNAGTDSSVVATFLLHWLDRVETEGTSSEYMETVREYLGSGVMKDIEDIQVSESPSALKQLLRKKCTELHAQLDSFKSQLDVLQAVFDRASGAKDLCVGAKKTEEKRTDYDSLPSRLRECSAAMESLEKTAAVVCRDLAVHVMGNQGISSRTASVSATSRSSHLAATNSTLNLPPTSSSDTSRDSRLLEGDTHYFEVTMETAGGLQTQKRVLKVNMTDGTLQIMKGVDESTAQVYFQWQVKQLINSRSKERKLGIILEGPGRRDVTFETLKAREHFCQVIQVLKKRHQTADAQEEQDSITVFTGTFNMGDAPPPPLLDSWLLCQGTGKTMLRTGAMAHDIYAIGTQETQVNEKDWVTKLKNLLKKLHNTDYDKVAVYTLWGMRLVVLVKAEHSNKISHVQNGQVRTGIGNALGNKGAVGISFTFANTSLCFINCHLTSGNEKCSRRNQNYHDILKGLGSLKQARQISTFDLTYQFHHLFFFGDLNYRIDLPATRIVQLSRDKDYEELMKEEQLCKEKKQGRVFVGFREEKVAYPPTYRYYRCKRTVEDYDWIKQKGGGRTRINVPSYCDRVLWKSYPGLRVTCLAYGCTNDIMTSDHSPVFAVCQLFNMAPYFNSGPGLALAYKAEIKFGECKAKIMTNSRTHFFVELYSTCWEGVHRSSSNTLWSEPLGNTVRPSWLVEDMPQGILPIISDRKYLEMQHVLVSIKSNESDESYAECCLSLSGFISRRATSRLCTLTHQGLEVGELEINCLVNIPGMEQDPREGKDYVDLDSEFIYTEIDISAPRMVPSDSTSRLRPQATVDDPTSVSPRSRSQASFDDPMPMPSRFRSQPSLDDPTSVPSSRIGAPLTNGSAAQNKSPSFPRKFSEPLPPAFPIPDSLDLHMPPAVPAKTSRHTHPSQVASPSASMSLPPVPPKPYLAHVAHNPVPVPRSAPRNVRELLLRNNMGQYCEMLINNGYDDIRFIHETSDEELRDVGIASALDRGKLLAIFREFHCSR